VKTLAIRSTAEEVMMARRAETKGKEQKLPNLTDDLSMRHFIANPRFIDAASSTPAFLNIPLLDVPLTQPPPSAAAVDAVQDAGSISALSESHGTLLTNLPDVSSRKKRRTVRFNDDMM